MFNISNITDESFQNIHTWINKIKQINVNASIMLCGNKQDKLIGSIDDVLVKLQESGINIPFHAMSVKNQHNHLGPFNDLHNNQIM